MFLFFNLLYIEGESVHWKTVYLDMNIDVMNDKLWFIWPGNSLPLIHGPVTMLPVLAKVNHLFNSHSSFLFKISMYSCIILIWGGGGGIFILWKIFHVKTILFKHSFKISKFILKPKLPILKHTFYTMQSNHSKTNLTFVAISRTQNYHIFLI